MLDSIQPAATERLPLMFLLPTERLEDIFRHLLPPYDAPESESEARATRLDAVLALMLTCRTLHAVGRRVLYHTPQIRHHFNGHRECVHDLTDLPAFVNAYSLPGFGAFAERDMAPGWALQGHLLQPCTQLRRVTVTICGSQQARGIASVLGAMPQLDFLHIWVADHELERLDTTTERVLLRTFLEHFRLARQPLATGHAVGSMPSRLDTLVLSPSSDSAFWSLMCLVELGDLVQAVTRGLRLEVGCLYSFHSVAPFLPNFTDQTGASHLEELALSYKALALSDRDKSMRALSGNRLTRFDLEGPAPRDHAVLKLEHYTDGTTSRGFDDLPDAFLSAFPALVSLTVSHNAGLSTDKLELLNSASPNLERLDLFGSRWRISSVSPPPETLTTTDLADFETRLIGALSRFERLRFVDLGYMLLKEADRDDSSLAKMAAWARTRKVSVAWSGCA